jgi:hypothetical protein
LVANDLMRADQAKVDRREREQTVVSDTRKILNKDMLSFFRGIPLRQINSRKFQEYLETLQKRKVSAGTLRIHRAVLHKILRVLTGIRGSTTAAVSECGWEEVWRAAH